MAALTRGGLTFRKKEGLPPYGQVDRLAERLDIVAAVVGESMRTANVLGERGAEDEDRARRGGNATGRLDWDPTVDNFFRVEPPVHRASGLATDRVRSALEEVDGTAADR